jgi:translation initiation factor RLI1
MFKNAYSIGYLPEEMVRVNRQDLTFKCTNFRAYSKKPKRRIRPRKQLIRRWTNSYIKFRRFYGRKQHIMSGVPENSVGTDNWGYYLHKVVTPGHDHTVTIGNHTHTVD